MKFKTTQKAIKIKAALIAIISDSELYAGGIPDAERLLNDLGMTQIQSGKIIGRLYSIVETIDRQTKD